VYFTVLAYFLNVEPLAAHKLITESMEKNSFRPPTIRAKAPMVKAPIAQESRTRKKS
jgi:hypothetical protein